MAGTPHKLSTSALAKALDLPLNQLFATLKDYGWIRKADDGWLLTAKGEFEGGEYVHSKRFGRYIVWPEALLEHRLLVGLEANRRLGGGQLAKRLGLTVRELNRILAERGLLEPGHPGWRLTAAGERAGGVEFDSDHNGLPYTLWPEALLEDPALTETLGSGRVTQADTEAPQPQSPLSPPIGDLFSAADAKPAAEPGATEGVPGNRLRQALDGHHCASHGELLICNWLYLAGLVHACGRCPPDAPHRAAFYLPQQQLSIEYLDEHQSPGELGQHLGRLEWYREHDRAVIEVRAEHLEQLDDYLGRALRRHGVEVL